MKCVAVIVSLLPCCLGFRPSFRPFRTKLFDKVGGRVTPVLMMTKEDASMDLNDNPTALIRGPTTSKVKMWTKPLLKVFHSVDKLGFSGTLLSWELWVGGLLLLAPFMEFSVPFLNPPHSLLGFRFNDLVEQCSCLLLLHARMDVLVYPCIWSFRLERGLVQCRKYVLCAGLDHRLLQMASRQSVGT